MYSFVFVFFNFGFYNEILNIAFKITGTMSVDAKFAKAGLKSVSKLHTSTYFDGKISMDGWKLLEAEMNMPKDTIDVLDVSVDFFSLQNNEYAVIKSKNEVLHTYVLALFIYLCICFYSFTVLMIKFQIFKKNSAQTVLPFTKNKWAIFVL